MEALVRRVCNEHGRFEPRLRHHTNELSMLLALAAHGRGRHAAAADRALRRAGHRRRAADQRELSSRGRSSPRPATAPTGAPR